MGADALEAVPALLDVLYHTNDYSTQNRTALSLARIGPEILPLLKREINTAHSLHVIEVLHYLGEPGAPLLIEAMRSKNPGFVRGDRDGRIAGGCRKAGSIAGRGTAGQDKG
jgi:hypothetical protein